METTEEFVAGILTHHGVKGMRWGVRKQRGTSSRGPIRRGITKANTALDAGSHVVNEGEKALVFLPQKHRDMAASATQSRVLGVAREINRNPKYHGKDLKKSPKLKKDYYDEVQKHAMSIYKEELGKARDQAVTDFITSVFDPGGMSMHFSAPRSRVRHDAGEDRVVLLTLNFDVDDLDQIQDVNAVSPSLQQSEEFVRDVLAHHGVKGMRWGTRKDRQVGVSKSRKGSDVPASEDARKANDAHNKAHHHGTAALSNQELQHLVNRLNLERQYNQLRPTTGSEKAARAVADVLTNVGKQQVARVANDYAGKQVGNILKTKK